MIEELMTFGAAIAMPLCAATSEVKIPDIPVTEIFSNTDRGFDFNGVYLKNIGNKYTLKMPAELNIQKIIEDKTDRLLSIFISQLNDLNIDFDEDCGYFNFLSEIRNNELEYSLFLFKALQSQNCKVYNAISIFLSQKKFDFISSDEENFILQILRYGTLDNQSFALQAILNWDNISNLDAINDIKIANRYLQEDLEDFIAQKEG